MPQADPLPRFVIRWQDRNSEGLHESPSYLVHEEADKHFRDLVSDWGTRSAVEIEMLGQHEAVLQSWQMPQRRRAPVR